MAKFCGQCGTELVDEALLCIKCGAGQDDDGESVVATKVMPDNIKMNTIGDYMYENDYRDDLTDTIIEATKGLSRVRFKTQLTTKQVKNAISICNNDFTFPDVIMMRDTTDLGSMKQGLVITCFGAYYIWEGKMESKVKFNQVKKMEVEAIGFLTKLMQIKFTLYNGRESIFKLHTTEEVIPSIFIEIAKCIGRYREDYPIEIIELEKKASETSEQSLLVANFLKK